MASFAAPFTFPLGGDIVEAVGLETAATFAMSVESGARVTYSWRTDVLTSWNGKEQRIGLLDRPRQRYEFSSLLNDEQQRAVLATLAGLAVTAPAFLLALAYEDLVVVAATGAALDVTSLAHADWAVPGQRVVVVSPEGESGESFIQSVAGSTIVLDAISGSVAVPGARIMPGVAVYLEPTQQLSHYAVNVTRWDLVAIGAQFRFGTSTALPGTGAAVTTYDGLPVWNVGVQSAQAGHPLHAGVSMLDRGFGMRPIETWLRPAWGRSLRIESDDIEDWQWLKRFLHTVCGQQKAFLLPSGHPDLVPIGDASTGEIDLEGTGYVDSWFSSLAHRRIALVQASGVSYRTVTDATDNGDGTQRLELDSPLVGDVLTIQFLELVRLESDDVTVNWHGASFSCEVMARVVQR